MNEVQHDYSDVIETIESAYEFMLAYAAQGRDTDKDASGRSEIRETLESLAAALVTLQDTSKTEEMSDQIHVFANTLANDATDAGRAVGLALAGSRVSSQLVDNLNASIHLRAVLTNLFLLDEAINCQ